MNTRASGLVVGLLVLTVAGCTVSSHEQASSSSVASAVVSTAPEGTTSSTPPASTTSTSPPDITRFCTEVGCDSQLTIELSKVDITPEATYGIEICIDGDCATATITIDVADPETGRIILGRSGPSPGPRSGQILMWVERDSIEYFLPEREYGASASVAFVLRDADGSVLAETEEGTEVPLERSQPNGPECPPICFFGWLTV